MEVDEYERIAALEDDYWWYQTTRGVMSDLLAPWLGDHQLLLDVGSGTGAAGAWLARHGTVVAVDHAEEALPYLRPRSLSPVRAKAEHLPFADATFDAVVAVNFLYAVPDPAAAVSDMARVVVPGGAVLVMEPAFAGLHRAHDARVHGKRRFRRADLGRSLEAAGLHLERSTYAYSFLAPPAAVQAVVHRLAPAGRLGQRSAVHRRPVDRVLGSLATRERAWLRRRNLPVGTSVLAVASRPRRTSDGRRYSAADAIGLRSQGDP